MREYGRQRLRTYVADVAGMVSGLEEKGRKAFASDDSFSPNASSPTVVQGTPSSSDPGTAASRPLKILHERILPV